MNDEWDNKNKNKNTIPIANFICIRTWRAILL